VGYIAKEHIAVGEALAYSRGQRVEADAVKANGWEGLVVGEDTKEAREIKAEITGREPGDFDTKTTAPAARAAAAKTQEG
jgi:Tfp pilus assembly major pilin PilA